MEEEYVRYDILREAFKKALVFGRAKYTENNGVEAIQMTQISKTYNKESHTIEVYAIEINGDVPELLMEYKIGEV